MNILGFPDFILDAEKLDERYKDLEVSQATYFENNIHANQFNLRRNLQNLGTPVNKTRYIQLFKTLSISKSVAIYLTNKCFGKNIIRGYKNKRANCV